MVAVTLEDESSKSPERQRAVRKLHRFLDLLDLVPDGVITMGLAIACYVRYTYYGYTSLLSVGGSGLLIVVSSITLRCYWKRSTILTSFYHLWLGCLLGLVSLLDISSNLDHKIGEWENLANLLLVSSVVCRALVQVLLRCCRTLTFRLVWENFELLELVGGGVAAILAAPGDQLGSLLVLMAALGVVLTAVRVGSLVAVLSLGLLIFTCEHYFFPELHLSTNPFGLIVLITRLAVPPLIDQFCGGFGRLDQWTGLIMARPFYHHLIFSGIMTMECIFFVTHAISVRNHAEWYVVVPLFGLLAIFWLIMHVIFAIVMATLAKKFSSTRISLFEDVNHLKKALAARGLRHFALVASQLTWLCVATTVLTGLMCWTTQTPYSFSLWLIVGGIELMLIELLAVFGRNLGGTCIGYALVLPQGAAKPDGSLTLLPANFIQDASAQSTKTLRTIDEFFAEHMVTNYDSDWSLGGVSANDLEQKMSNFFNQTTSEGTRYDTYCYYYSGPTDSSGDWALKDGVGLSLERILSVWSSSNPEHRASRLLLICDCEHSHQWLSHISQLSERHSFIALQTCKWQSGADTDSATSFTEAWTEFNSYDRAGRPGVFGSCKPMYAVSRHWVDFDFRSLDSEEIVNYWLRNLPSFTHGCLKWSAKLSARSPLNVLFRCCVSILRRWRLVLCFPSNLDTGHGFRLVNS